MLVSLENQGNTRHKEGSVFLLKEGFYSQWVSITESR